MWVRQRAVIFRMQRDYSLTHRCLLANVSYVLFCLLFIYKFVVSWLNHNAIYAFAAYGLWCTAMMIINALEKKNTNKPYEQTYGITKAFWASFFFLHIYIYALIYIKIESKKNVEKNRKCCIKFSIIIPFCSRFMLSSWSEYAVASKYLLESKQVYRFCD